MFLESVFRGIFWLVFIFSIIQLCYWGILRLLTVWGQMFSEEQQGAVLGSLRGNYGSGGEGEGWGGWEGAQHNNGSKLIVGTSSRADEECGWRCSGFEFLIKNWMIWTCSALVCSALIQDCRVQDRMVQDWQLFQPTDKPVTKTIFLRAVLNFKRILSQTWKLKTALFCDAVNEVFRRVSNNIATTFGIKNKSALHQIENKTMAAFNKSTHMCTHWQNARHWQCGLQSFRR